MTSADSLMMLLKMVGALTAIVGAIVAAGWLVRRYGPQTIAGRGGKRLLQVKESASLGPKRAVHLVECCGRLFLVGASDGSVNLIAALDHASGSGMETSATGSSGGFDSLIEEARAKDHDLIRKEDGRTG